MVWLAGEALCVSFNGETTVQIEATERGLAFLVAQLRHRAAQRHISEPGNPTQWDVAQAMKKALDEGLRPKVAPRSVDKIDTTNLEDYL